MGQDNLIKHTNTLCFKYIEEFEGYLLYSKMKKKTSLIPHIYRGGYMLVFKALKFGATTLHFRSRELVFRYL